MLLKFEEKQEFRASFLEGGCYVVWSFTTSHYPLEQKYVFFCDEHGVEGDLSPNTHLE